MKRKSLNVRKINHEKILIFLNDPKIKKIYDTFKINIIKIKDVKNFSAAISGGPDSLSLAYLLKCYSIKNSKKIEYYHVDHGLKKNSNKEANYAKFLLKKIQINLKIIKWKGNKPHTNIQSIARKNRYNLLLKKISKKKNNFLFLGHNMDDLIENFILRVSRGSGLDGFVSFNNIFTDFKETKIVRPLINIEKNNLIYLSKKVFGDFIFDLSNEDIKFKRVRIRKIIEDLKEEGINYKKIYETISNLSESNLTIKHYTKKNILNNVTYLRSDKYLLKKNFFEQSNEVILRSFIMIFRQIGNKYYVPRGKKIINLINNIKKSSYKKSTLGGCIIEKLNESILICKENTKKKAKLYNLPLV